MIIKEERKAEQKCNLEIFSDFRGEILNFDANQDNGIMQDFYLELIEEDNLPVARWSNPNDWEKLCDVQFGKLRYFKEITLPPRGADKRFKFVINNKYKIHDKLVWIFQGMSPYVVIKLRVQPSCGNMNTYLRINHPQIAEIIKEHLKKIGCKNDIDVKTGKVKVPNLIFTMNKNTLPYQGFEISWDCTVDGGLSKP